MRDLKGRKPWWESSKWRLSWCMNSPGNSCCLLLDLTRLLADHRSHFPCPGPVYDTGAHKSTHLFPLLGIGSRFILLLFPLLTSKTKSLSILTSSSVLTSCGTKQTSVSLPAVDTVLGTKEKVSSLFLREKQWSLHVTGKVAHSFIQSLCEYLWTLTTTPHPPTLMVLVRYAVRRLLHIGKD